MVIITIIIITTVIIIYKYNNNIDISLVQTKRVISLFMRS